MNAELIDIPFEGGWCVPTLWVLGTSGAELQKEPSHWALSSIKRGKPYASVRSAMRSILRLVRMYISKGIPTLDEAAFKELLESLMVDELGASAYSTRQQVFRDLNNYSDWLATSGYGYLPIATGQKVKLPGATKGVRTLHVLLRANETEFFSHLKARKTSVVPDVQLGPKARTSKRNAGSLTGMSEAFAWRMIEAESNPSLRALWLLGFFGGPRLSESVNLWVCDVLPGGQRKTWFREDVFVDLPLVVICDPMLSCWTGQLGDYRETRSDYLRRCHNIAPRPRMQELDHGLHRGKFAGFKGMAATNADLLARQIVWASERAGHLFGNTVEAVLAERNRFPLARNHPFLFVNTDRTKSEVLGDMMTMSNIRKGFERAVRRIGEVPYRFNQRPHGMRHTYKDLLSPLTGNDQRVIQVCMGHRSAASQDSYGTLQWQALRHAMAQARSEGPRHG